MTSYFYTLQLTLINKAAALANPDRQQSAF